ncbi:hypothetical protein pipiens_014183, partial [Culex pipiens pipiens]
KKSWHQNIFVGRNFVASVPSESEFWRVIRRVSGCCVDISTANRYKRGFTSSKNQYWLVCNSWDLRAAWPLLPFRVECFSEPLLRRLKLVMVVVV